MQQKGSVGGMPRPPHCKPQLAPRLRSYRGPVVVTQVLS